MAFYTDGVVPWNSLDNNTRAPLASELENGYPCGEADQQLFNWTAGWPVGNIWNMILQSGITPDTDKLLDLSRAVQSSKVKYTVAGGSANAITAALSPAPVSYTVGIEINVKINTANTGPVTINLNGLGAVDVVDRIGAALAAGDFVANEVVKMVYDGTRFRLIRLSDKGNQSIASAGWVKLGGGLIMQWGGFSGTTQSANVNSGVYESNSISVSWPIAFPNAALQVVSGTGTDVVGIGLQEQAWFYTKSVSGGGAFVACRQSGATIGGSFIVFGH